MTDQEVCHGAVLGRSEIEARAAEIFGDTWRNENLQAAKYYLTIAEDMLIMPGRKRRGFDQRVTSPIVLQPGQVVFVTTAERFKMPWDLAGHVSLRFSYALRGALVLTGGVVDPGYGMDTDGGERLHFLIANIGRELLSIQPGRDQIASLQLIKVCGEVDQAKPASTRELERQLFESDEVPELPLEFFQQVADVDRRLQKEVVNLQAGFSAIETGTKSLIYFGVFLLTVTVFGFSITMLADLAAEGSLAASIDRLDDVLPDSWPAASVVLAALIAATVLLWYTVTLLGRGLAEIGKALGRAADRSRRKNT